MKKKIINFNLISLFAFLLSCGGPDALVINTVHADGSVTRKVILTYDKDEFDLTDCQVPIDSTWAIEKKYEISDEDDTTWTLTAVKDFASVDLLNNDYNNYPGSNEGMKRWAEFERKFKWFNTIYRFSENIEKALDGIPPDQFYTTDELHLFYMPDELLDETSKGPDSTMIKDLEERAESWMANSLVRAFILEIEALAEKIPDSEIDMEYLNTKSSDLAMMILEDVLNEYEVIDSILGKGYYESHQVVIDSAMTVVEDQFDVALSTDKYLVQATMPGELMSTNGYIDNDGNILWKVDGDCFLSSDYIMWAESKTTNWWAWIISVLFLLFVATGFLYRIKKK
ncbi:MAG TPA: hypothetical protein VMW76_00750 [Bacteroidales bacterium]|nr:hypothetical protein [Bacteroidales bacterium]